MSSLEVRAIDDKDLRKQPAPSAQQAYRVFLSEPAFDRAVERGDHDTTREIGGVLVGELLRDDAGPYLRIDATIDALHAEEKGAELTFTHATWEHIHKEMDSRHHNKRVVGWYHTHPGFGVFLSDRDQFIHKSFFNLPFQVAFVYDPKSREHGLFTWHDNEVWRARRYWIGPHEQVWDGMRAPGDKQGRDQSEHDRRKLPEPVRDDRGAHHAQPLDDGSQPGPLGLFIVIGVILLVVGGFAGHWLGIGSANQALAEAQLAIVNARSDGAKAEVALLQNDLVGILRDTMGDDAMHRPLIQAIGVLDRITAALPGESSVGFALPPFAPGSAAPPAAGGDPRWAAFAAQLSTARASLSQLEQARGSAQVVLARLALEARRGTELPKELVRELGDHRSGLGGLYAELAATAAKAGDPAHARRLLATAAHLDPGNRTRYEKQLQSFDPSGRLPSDRPDATGSARPGEPR